jgi:hypothetical protein
MNTAIVTGATTGLIGPEGVKRPARERSHCSRLEEIHQAGPAS